MSKHLVVVVHGVGVKEAGVSSDLLASALSNDDHVPISSDDLHMPEGKDYDAGNKRKLFPCRIRRYKNNGDERVVSDFYWGDVSKIGSGNTGLVLGVIKAVLGVSHIIRENAHEIFNDSPFLKKLSRAFVQIIHGPVAATTLLIVVGLLLNWALSSYWVGEEAVALHEFPLFSYAIGLAALVSGLILLKRRISYLEALLWSWLVVMGGLMIVSQGQLDYLGGPTSLDLRVTERLCFDDQHCTDGVVGVFVHGVRLVFFLGCCALAATAIWLLLSFAAFWKREHLGLESTAILVPHAAAGMLILWFLFIAIVLSAMSSLPNLVPHDNLLASSLFLLAATLLFIIILGFAGLLMSIRKSKWANAVDLDNFFPDEVKKSDNHRFIVHSFVKAALLIGFTLFMITAFLFLIEFWLFNEPKYMKWFLIILGGLVLIIGYFTTQVRAGLIIATDIITYLNDYSWHSRSSGTNHTRTLLERLLGFVPNVGNQHGYYMRRRIKDRMSVLVTSLVVQEKPNRLTIVAHSQGTVIAADVIEEKGALWRKKMPNEQSEPKIDFITMGSPLTHIHSFYFPGIFPPLKKRKFLQKHSSRNKTAVLNNWHNIFRIDDYVGTYIDPDNEWPNERPVAANGHTDYWIDNNVIRILNQLIDGKESKPRSRAT